ncbi:MAG: hypothetical protein U0103_16540 [Candidatus Obscuribacterales bacterium]
MKAKFLTPEQALAAHFDGIQARADVLSAAFQRLAAIGPQCTWLGSRTLGAETLVYKWVAEVSRVLVAEGGIAQKTGGNAGLMEAPHYGCYLANRPDLAVALGVSFLDEEFNQYVTEQSIAYKFGDLNSRHDALFFGSRVFNILPGRLGTLHEKVDLLNRMKLGLLPAADVFILEMHGYYSRQMEFQTNTTGLELGPRISPADYESINIVDILSTKPEDFARRILAIMSGG